MSLAIENEQRFSIVGMYRTIKNIGIEGYNTAKTIVQPRENQTVQSRALEVGNHILSGIAVRGSFSACCATLGATVMGLASLAGRATPGIAATATAMAAAAAIQGAVGHIREANRDVCNNLEKARSSVPFAVGTVALGVLASATTTGATKGALIAYTVSCLMKDTPAFAPLAIVAGVALRSFDKTNIATEVGGVLLGVLMGFICSDFCNILTIEERGRNP